MRLTADRRFCALGVFVMVVAALLAGGCTHKKADLDAGFQHARLTLMRVAKDPLAAGSLASMLEAGGSPADYVASCLPEKPRFSSFENEKPTHPWTVVIKYGPAKKQYVIEAYGEDLEKPLKEEAITVTQPPKP